MRRCDGTPISMAAVIQDHFLAITTLLRLGASVTPALLSRLSQSQRA